MKAISKILIALFFCWISQCLCGQEIIKADRGDYEYKYGDLYYSYEELKDLIQFNPDAIKMHQKALRAKKTYQILYITEGVATAASILFYITGGVATAASILATKNK